MMNVLAISTSTDMISVCVLKDKGFVCELNARVNKKHSAVLLSAIDSLLKLTDTDMTDMDLFACDTGPGSFTGIRIGTSTVNAFAAAGNKPLVGISSLDILASGVFSYGNTIASCIYARNDQVYGCLYKMQNEQGRYFAGSIDDFLLLTDDIPDEKILFVGDGGVAFKEKMIGKLRGRAVFSDISDNMVKAGQLASLALCRIPAAGGISPFYMKRVNAKDRISG
jgi:tRNA threonylcarbamoyladenosine biosynthesis protein TsaB